MSNKKNATKLFKLKLVGNSMWPFLKQGMKIRLRKISPKHLPEIGDVAVIKFKNGLLVHRILMIRHRKNDREYFTKGDRRLVGDGWMPHSRIAAVVDLPAVGRILGRAIGVYSLLLLIVGKILRRDRRRK
jgi:hypothetical protein